MARAASTTKTKTKTTTKTKTKPKPAPTPKRAKATANATKPATQAGEPIARAIAAAEAHRHDEVLDALLAAWTAAPSPALAALIDRASTLVPPTVTGLRGKTAAVRAAWTALASAPPAREVPALLAGLADAASSEGVKRLAQIAAWPRDPRVDAALVGLLEHVPYRATSTQPFWRALWPLLRRITDRDVHARLAAVDEPIAQHVAKSMSEWLRNQLAKVRASMVLADPAPAPPGQARLAALLEAGARAAAPREDLAHLLQAIYDAPDDDAPRLVYADALLERGDPRGELIALQCRTAPLDRAQKQRERALLEAHARSWLGPLEPVIMAGFRFERGFLAGCRIDNDKRDHVRAVVGHPSWATVRELRGSAAVAFHPGMRALRDLRFDSMHALRAEGIADAWRELLVDTPRPLERLYYDGLVNHREQLPGTQQWRRTIDDTELDALLRCSALPALRHLVIAEEPGHVLPRVVTAPVLARLASFGLTLPGVGPGFTAQPFEGLLRVAPVPVLTLQIRPDWHTSTYRFERGPAGYERLWLEVGETEKSAWNARIVGEALEILAVLPPSIREVRVKTRKHFDADSAQRLRRAIDAIPNLAVREIG